MLEDRLHHGLDVARRDDAFELDLRAQPVRELRAAVALRDALLAAGALDLGDRERREAEVEQVGADRLERLVTDECLHLLHAPQPNGSRRRAGARGPRTNEPPD